MCNYLTETLLNIIITLLLFSEYKIIMTVIKVTHLRNQLYIFYDLTTDNVAFRVENFQVY